MKLISEPQWPSIQMTQFTFCTMMMKMGIWNMPGLMRVWVCGKIRWWIPQGMLVNIPPWPLILKTTCMWHTMTVVIKTSSMDIMTAPGISQQLILQVEDSHLLL